MDGSGYVMALKGMYWQDWCSDGTTLCLGTYGGTLAIVSVADLSSGFS